MKTDTDEKIITYIKKVKKVKPNELAQYLKISRVAVHKQLSKLVMKGKIEKYGLTPHVYYSIVPPAVHERNPKYLWDYDYNELKKTESGRIKILERMINYGPEEGEKIPLNLVKKYWDKLDLYHNRKLLLELLLWGKYRSLHQNKQSFSIK